LDLAPLEDEKSEGKDHGSRSESSKAKTDEKKAQERDESRKTGYQKATAKAAEESKFAFTEIEEEDDNELLKSLVQARSLSMKKEK